MHNPFLIGDKIYLRSIEESDLDGDYQKWFNDAEVCRFNAHHRFPKYKQDLQDYYNNVVKSINNLVLAIVDKEKDKHIGNISLLSIEHINKTAELAVIIGNKDFWGKGIGTEAGKLIIEHGFKSLNLNRIYCGTSIENIGMQRLADSLGFVKEGTARQALYKNGKYNDVINYGLIKYEYQQ